MCVAGGRVPSVKSSPPSGRDATDFTTPRSGVVMEAAAALTFAAGPTTSDSRHCFIVTSTCGPPVALALAVAQRRRVAACRSCVWEAGRMGMMVMVGVGDGEGGGGDGEGGGGGGNEGGCGGGGGEGVRRQHAESYPHHLRHEQDDPPVGQWQIL